MLTTALLSIAVSITALCQYTVRDIGFVDLAGPTYAIVAEQDTDSGSRSDAGELGIVLRAALLESNTVGSVAEGEGRLILRDDRGRSLDLGLLGDLDATRLAAVDAVWSARHRELATILPDAFAVAVVHDPGGAHGLHGAVSSAFGQLLEYEAALPRPIFGKLETVTLGDTRGDRVIRWALDIPDAGGVALLYGRGKRAGPPIYTSTGVTELLAQLTLVGDSCECDTPRDWASEPSIPLRWNETTADRATDLLGFDPASPMVKAEVVRILSRGPQGGTPAVSSRVAMGADPAMMLLGYSEFEVGRELVPTVPDATHAPPPAGVRPEDETTEPGPAGVDDRARRGPSESKGPSESSERDVGIATGMIVAGAAFLVAVVAAAATFLRRPPA